MTPREFRPKPAESPQSSQTEADAQAVRDIAQRLQEITTRANWANIVVVMLYFGVFFVYFLSWVIIALTWNPHNLLSASLLLLAGFITLFACGWCGRFAKRTPRSFDVSDIAYLGGVKAIGPLFNVLEVTRWKDQQQAIRAALYLLLPQMKASDAHLLTPGARLTIHRWLHGPFDATAGSQCSPPLRLAALKALEQVGDARDLPVVERLANRTPRNYTEEKLKQAAIECLPMLLARSEEDHAKRTLLRASQMERADADTLLRPASGAGKSDAAELLRGTDSPVPPADSGG